MDYRLIGGSYVSAETWKNRLREHFMADDTCFFRSNLGIFHLLSLGPLIGLRWLSHPYVTVTCSGKNRKTDLDTFGGNRYLLHKSKKGKASFFPRFLTRVTKTLNQFWRPHESKVNIMFNRCAKIWNSEATGLCCRNFSLTKKSYSCLENLEIGHKGTIRCKNN